MNAHFRWITSGSPTVHQTVVIDSFVEQITDDFGDKYWQEAFLGSSPFVLGTSRS